MYKYILYVIHIIRLQIKHYYVGSKNFWFCIANRISRSRKKSQNTLQNLFR